MATRWILGFLVLCATRTESKDTKTLTLEDFGNVCGNSYTATRDTDYVVVWAGANLPYQSFPLGTQAERCKVSFESITDLDNVCIEVKNFGITDCDVTLRYYDNYGLDYQKAYGCHDYPEKFCRSNLGGVALEIITTKQSIRRTSYLNLKITTSSGEMYINSNDVTWIILGSFAGGTIFIAAILIVACRRKRSFGTVVRGPTSHHVPLVNEAMEESHPDSYPSHPMGQPVTRENNPSYPIDQPVTREYNITVPVAVNFR